MKNGLKGADRIFAPKQLLSIGSTTKKHGEAGLARFKAGAVLLKK
jgi:hypothetical protein